MESENRVAFRKRMAPLGCTHHISSCRVRSKKPLGNSAREKSFAKSWDRENVRKGSLNYGRVPLDWLTSQRGTKLLEDPRDPRAKSINATIQWLGSTVGFCFLEKMLREAGYILRTKDSQDRQDEKIRDMRAEITELQSQLIDAKALKC